VGDDLGLRLAAVLEFGGIHGGVGLVDGTGEAVGR
jgi:hypothetical protein